MTETSQRLYGLSALIDLIDEAHPKVWEQGQKALKEWAENKHWDYEDYNLEAQFLEANFAHWLPREEAYSVLVLLSSIVETQTLGYAGRIAARKGQAFDPRAFRDRVLGRVANYIKGIAGLDLTKNSRWQLLKDLMALRNIIVHRAGRPDERDRDQLNQICKRRPGVSLIETPLSWWRDPELNFTLGSCRYFAREVSEFFKSLLKDADLPAESSQWPNIQTGLA